MKEIDGKDARLRCRIVRGELRISIGVNVLAHAFVNGPVGDRLVYVPEIGEWDNSRLRVTDIGAFAKEVVHALLAEEEDGSGPLANLLDAAYQAVVDDGGLGFWMPGLDEEPDAPDAVARGAGDSTK